MRKKMLFFHNEMTNSKVLLNKKSVLFLELKKIVPVIDKNFTIAELNSKLDFLEQIIVLLGSRLEHRIVPEPPSILYLPREKIYKEVRIFNTDYLLLQGHEKDNEILLLDSLKNLVRASIKDESMIRCTFISKRAELDNFSK